MLEIKLNRDILQNLANVRLEEAKTLLESDKYDGAYYLSGYVIELAFKACIAKQTREYDFPNRSIVYDSYTHDLTKLLKCSSLGNEFNEKIRSSESFVNNWSCIKDWSEQSRYKTHEKQEAEDLFNAVSDVDEGVFEWIKNHW